MTPDSATAIATQLMSGFARRTGLYPQSQNERRRYLWTDAFAVCNFIELFVRTGNEFYRQCATDLIAQVHHVLGRYRADDYRHGWISGLDEEAGKRHPTMGGLRIGKPLRERQTSEPVDERLEWDRDGQYFHYLTKWMHALCRAAVVTGHRAHAKAAIELAEVAFKDFARKSASGDVVGIYWKMSTDLSRPLTSAVGLHDALDGFLTFWEVQHVVSKTNAKTSNDLTAAVQSMPHLCRARDWSTSDPLGIGGLLFDACRLAQLPQRHDDDGLLESIENAYDNGVGAFVASRLLIRPISQRLAFRELGLAIGLKAVPIILDATKQAMNSYGGFSKRWHLQYQSLADEIVRTWLACTQSPDELWQAHEDINDVMLATALIPNTILSVNERMPLDASS
jgi:hypothetical protein